MTPEQKTREAVRLLHEAQAELIEALKSEKSRRRGELVRQLHDVRRRLDTAYPYVSQAGQDFIVDQLLGGKRDGIFVDIGGYDGITGSNTFFFEAWRGWTGLLVEPVETSLEKARSMRRCACVGCAIAETDGKAEFIEVDRGDVRRRRSRGRRACFNPCPSCEGRRSAGLSSSRAGMFQSAPLV